MALRLLPDEQVRVRTRAHPRKLIAPAVRLLLLAAAAGFVQGLLSRGDLPEFLAPARYELSLAVWIVSGLAVLVGVVRPVLRWLRRTTVLTTQRLVQRVGGSRRRERGLPLAAVQDVQLRQRRTQRWSGAGDLTISYGMGHRWVLRQLPEAERFRRLILEEVHATHQRARWADDAVGPLGHGGAPDGGAGGYGAGAGGYGAGADPGARTRRPYDSAGQEAWHV